MIRLAVLSVVITSMVLANDGRRTTNVNTAIRAVEIPAFTIIGIEARTTNAKEAAGDGIIPQQWQKFFSEGIPDKIPNKIDENFYAVYSDYASDHNGEYRYVIGAKVKEGTAPPSGMVARRVPAGEYAIITSDKGPFSKVVPATWQKIFTLENEGKLKRAYQTDFEIYDQRAQDPQNGQIDIYIGLK
jgi:predicted transcriptional regulator YdeE